MGLDIIAYRKLEPAPQAEVASDGYPNEWEKFAHFGIDNPDETEEIEPGVYSFAETYHFKSSYGYNEWCDQLAQWEGPFTELINLCEDVIGPKVAGKLAKDFADYQTRADATGGDDFIENYRDFRKAFELAANGGAVPIL
jgi:hypothetical protein